MEYFWIGFLIFLGICFGKFILTSIYVILLFTFCTIYVIIKKIIEKFKRPKNENPRS